MNTQIAAWFLLIFTLLFFITSLYAIVFSKIFPVPYNVHCNYKMPLLTLTSDIGQHDFIAGTVKGKLLQSVNNFTIVDITHHLSPFNYPQAAYELGASYAAGRGVDKDASQAIFWYRMAAGLYLARLGAGARWRNTATGPAPMRFWARGMSSSIPACTTTSI